MAQRRRQPPQRDLDAMAPAVQRDSWKGPNYRPIVIEGHSESTQLQPMPAPQQPVAVGQRQQRSMEIVKGTHVERAQGFTIRTRQISGMTALATAAIWFLVRWALPMTTGGATAGALLVDMLTSPGGVELFESWRTQRRIDAQSAAMVDAYRKVHGVDD